MANIYRIDSSALFLTANISALGPAASRASILDLSKTDPSVAVAHSSNATGDIERLVVSDKVLLKGKRLMVFTKIALIGANESTRSTEGDGVTGQYFLDGGPDGLKAFPETGKDYVDPNVFLTFLIDII